MKMFRWCFLVCILFIAEADSSDNADKNCVMDLVFLMDHSKNITTDANGTFVPEKWNLMKNFVQSVVRNLNVSRLATNVAVVTFGNTGASPIIKLERWNTKGEVVAAIGRIEVRVREGPQYIWAAFFATRIFVLQSDYGDRPAIPNVIVAVTDVVPDTVLSELLEEVDRLKAGAGASIIGIEVAKNDENDTAMQMVVTAPSSDNYFRVSGLENLGAIVDTITRATCRAARFPQNSTDCVMDLAFAIDDWKTIATDANGTYNATKWNRIKNFFQRLVLRLDVRPNATHIACFTFGGGVSTVSVKLNQWQRKENVVWKVGRMHYRPYNPSGLKGTGYAFRGVSYGLFRPINGDRPEIPNVLLLFTDYITETTLLTEEVNRAKGFGTSIIGIGFTNVTNATVMETVVSAPVLDNYFEVSGLEDLDSIVDTIAVATCRAARRRLAAMMNPDQ